MADAAAIVALLTLLAVVLIPATIVYYLWLVRHVAPRLISLPTRLAITILALWVALPWIVLAIALWVA